MAKLILKREECIQCGACAAVCAEFFKMSDDGKAAINGGQEAEGNQELDITTEQIEKCKGAADVCPVKVIEVQE